MARTKKPRTGAATTAATPSDDDTQTRPDVDKAMAPGATEADKDAPASGETAKEEAPDLTTISEPDATDDGTPDLTEPAEPAAEDSPDPMILPETSSDTARDTASVLPEHDRRETPPASPAVTDRTAVGGGFLPMVLGGVVAAVIGFIAGQYATANGIDFLGFGSTDDPLEQQVTEQRARLDSVDGQLGTLNEQLTALSETDLQTPLDDLGARIDQVASTAQSLDSRLSELESRPEVEVIPPEDIREAYEQELADMRRMIEDELAQVEERQEQAEATEAEAARATQRAAMRAALADVTTAIDTGSAYPEPLSRLADASPDELPQALRDNAESGVATLSELQQGFPDAARQALNASVREQRDSGEVSRVSAFLTTQLGTRSLEPREGDDPDAVLSRAEAALQQGDLGAALSELDALPEAGQQAMADWRARAETRNDVVTAAAALGETSNN